MTLEIFKTAGTIPVLIDSLYILVKGTEICAAAIFINLLGIPIDDYVSFKSEKIFIICSCETGVMVKVSVGELWIYDVGSMFVLLICSAKFEPTFMKWSFNCLQMSVLSVYLLLFLSISVIVQFL